MSFETHAAARRDALKALRTELADAGAELMHVHTAEMNGVFRTKTTPLKLSTDGDALNGILFCVGHADGAPVGDPVFSGAISNADNGFPNIMALADPASVRHHGWDKRFASVITDAFRIDGAPCPIDPRWAVRRQEERAAALGYEPRFAFEYEFGIFHADEGLMREGRFRELKPWGNSYINYDLTRSGTYQDFFATYVSRMASIGITVSSVVTEYGQGMYEIALGPKPALEAADDAVRAKLHLKELCAERGLVATFMTRFQPPGRESACGAHCHQSLWKDGRNTFAGGANALTEEGRLYLGGLLARMVDSHLLFRPTINTYRRMERLAWSPENVSWGFENRAASIRAITTPSAGAARFEHRVPGADVNPYLCIAAMLAAGLDGIEEKIEPIAISPGVPAMETHVGLPRSLEASMAAFGGSDFIKRVFGPEMRDHYVLSRQFELDAFEAWRASHISDFEWQRYFMGT
jgi:glutamine synthetase